MKSKKNINKENWIPCERERLYVGIGAAILIIVIYVFNIKSKITSTKVQADLFVAPIIALDLLIQGSKSLYIDEKGVTVYYFGLRLRFVEWANVENVGTGYSAGGAAIVITLKGGKQYTLERKVGYRDVLSFGMLHFKLCIVLESDKVDKARPLIEKYYGSFAYEYIPPND